MRHSTTLCLALLLCLGCAGCGNKYHSAPLEAPVPLGYGETSGTLYVTTEVGGGNLWLPTAKTSLEYTVRPQEDGLLWRVKATGRYLGIRDNTADPNEKNSLYPLQQSHEPLVFTVQTDRLGNVQTMGDPASAATGAALGKPFWKDFYQAMFSMVFVPFSADSGTTGAVVSHGQCGLMPQDSPHFPAPDIVLAGKQDAFGDRNLVLHYENASNEYKNANRQKCIDSVKVDFVIDGKSCIVLSGRTIYQGVNGRRYVTISREEE